MARPSGPGAEGGRFADVLAQELLDVEPPGGMRPDQIPMDRQGLVWAARQLEARLWATLIDEALKPGSGSGLFGEGFASGVYGGWFTDMLAGMLVGHGAGQLADLLLEQFSRDASEGAAPSGENARSTQGVTSGRGSLV
ncbi:MAG: hypothetical protein IMX02_11865 [Limnochordaceae bacterium]|nr:hypothetical protein [Limnochordaceae bacterium]